MDGTISHVLMVDDDHALCDMVREYLSRNGIRVTSVSDGKQLLQLLGREAIDLLLLDLRLPGEDGMRLALTVRQNSKVPIIIVTGLGDETDRIMGLEMYADDYITKPFSLRELLARMRAVLRRSGVEVAPRQRDESLRAYQFAGWELNVRLHRLVSPRGEKIAISRSEFSLLNAFLSAPQRVLTREQLLELSRLRGSEIDDRSIDAQVLRLRRKLEVDSKRPTLIRTERGVGYFLDTAVKHVR